MLDPADGAPITQLLVRWREGDEQALGEVTALLYDELSAIAHRRRVAEGRDHTLDTAGLVHEMFLRLAGNPVALADRDHFFRLASRVMRNVLVDHARAALAGKRGAGLLVSLNTTLEGPVANEADLERLHHAIEALGQQDPPKAHMVDLVYFGGVSAKDAAQVMGMPVSTFYRELSFARAWLKVELVGS